MMGKMIFLAVVAAACGENLAEEPAARVEAILKARFHRVAGDQAGQAVIYSDSASVTMPHFTALYCPV